MPSRNCQSRAECNGSLAKKENAERTTASKVSALSFQLTPTRREPVSSRRRLCCFYLGTAGLPNRRYIKILRRRLMGTVLHFAFKPRPCKQPGPLPMFP